MQPKKTDFAYVFNSALNAKIFLTVPSCSFASLYPVSRQSAHLHDKLHDKSANIVNLAMHRFDLSFTHILQYRRRQAESAQRVGLSRPQQLGAVPVLRTGGEHPAVWLCARHEHGGLGCDPH